MYMLKEEAHFLEAFFGVFFLRFLHIFQKTNCNIYRTRNGIYIIFKCIDVKFSHIVIIRDVGVLSCGFGYMRHISNLLGSLEGVIVAGDVRHDGTFIRFWSVD